MSDSFMHNHQSALDSFIEDKAIQDLEDAGIYPVPDNDALMEDIYEDVLANHPEMSGVNQVRLAEEIFRDLPEPGDYDED
tara:strand:+ start:49 stop:288 length:240 start_codon:yes stop_codon:yes gene_type:complete